MSERKIRLDGIPEDVRAFVDATMALLDSYMPGTCEITMMVGRNIEATLTIQGGPLTRDVLEDVMAHLAFYKKYFPKSGEADARLTSPEQIICALEARWKEHREAITADPL